MIELGLSGWGCGMGECFQVGLVRRSIVSFGLYDNQNECMHAYNFVDLVCWEIRLTESQV
jgi:hypothetical protein